MEPPEDTNFYPKLLQQLQAARTNIQTAQQQIDELTAIRARIVQNGRIPNTAAQNDHAILVRYGFEQTARATKGALNFIDNLVKKRTAFMNGPLQVRLEQIEQEIWETSAPQNHRCRLANLHRMQISFPEPDHCDPSHLVHRN
jgi:hypothetical protein